MKKSNPQSQNSLSRIFAALKLLIRALTSWNHPSIL
jgi:hypothetical protein